MNEYVRMRRIVYGDGATFVCVCEKCGRFVKPPKTMSFNGLDELVQESNKINCSKCGSSKMPFEGFV